jgi:uncharacterized protein
MKSSISGPDPESTFLEAERYEEQGKFKKAFDCLLRAARLGHDGCQLNVGNFYSSGKGVRKNPEQAAYWYRQAYKNGNSTGAFNLAIDRRNDGNIRSAFVWFKKAWAMNDGEAAIELAKLYVTKRDGTKKAIELLKKASVLKRAEISDEAKHEAKILLLELTAGKKR